MNEDEVPRCGGVESAWQSPYNPGDTLLVDASPGLLPASVDTSGREF